MALWRRLTQFQTLLAQQSLRSAIAKPRPLPNPHSRFLRCSSPQAAASRSPSSHFLWHSSGSAGTLLPVSSAAAVAAAARAAAKRWLTARAAGSLELFSLQRRRSSGWLSSSSAFLRGAPWARWLPSPDGVVLMLIGANVAVYMLWQLADQSFMMNHFTISLDNVKSGRLHTVLTSAFSHKDGHLFSNMIGFYFFGSSISSMFGPSFLLYLYAAGAVVGSTFFLIEKAFIAPRKQVYLGWDGSRDYLLGASGAVNAIMLLQIFLNPKGLIYFYFVIPVPAALVGAAWIGLDLLRVNKGQASGSTHLGGALVAALVWARIRKGWI